MIHCHNLSDTNVTFNKSLTRLLELVFAGTGSHLIKTWRRSHKLPRLHNSVLRLTFGFLLKVGSLSNTFLKICINLYPGNLCYLNTGKFFSEENYTPCRCLKSTVRIIITYYNYHIITTNDHLTRTRTVNSSLHWLPNCRRCACDFGHCCFS